MTFIQSWFGIEALEQCQKTLKNSLGESMFNLALLNSDNPLLITQPNSILGEN